MKLSLPESGPTPLGPPTPLLWPFSMHLSAQSDSIADRSLCGSPRKSPKNSASVRAGTPTETSELVLYFPKQVFHNLCLSRRPFGWPAFLSGADCHFREVLPAPVILRFTL